MASVEVNKVAPDFVINDYKENEFKLSNFRNKKNILIVFNRGFI